MFTDGKDFDFVDFWVCVMRNYCFKVMKFVCGSTGLMNLTTRMNCQRLCELLDPFILAAYFLL